MTTDSKEATGVAPEKSKSEVFDKIKDASTQWGVASCALTDTFESLGLDSLDQLELIMETEEIFSIELSDEQAMACSTVGELVDLVTARL